MPRKRLHVGTDCSGTDAPLYALKRTKGYQKKKFAIVHEWSCDTSPNARKFIFMNHKPKRFYEDILSRKHSALAPVSIYFNGFPCQPWSSLGRKLGWRDQRMNVYRAMVKTLATGKVKCFVLENVPRMVTHNGGKTWRKVLNDLTKAGFRCSWDIYDAQHFGVPQIRRRVYIVGFKENLGVTPTMPVQPMLERPLLSDFLDDDTGTPADLPDPSSQAGKVLRFFSRHLKKADMETNAWAVDIDSSPKFAGATCEICPTLTHSRSAGFWITSKKRRMNAAEQFRCQGFPTEDIVALSSRRAMGSLAGNAMCVPVLTYILDSLLAQLGF